LTTQTVVQTPPLPAPEPAPAPAPVWHWILTLSCGYAVGHAGNVPRWLECPRAGHGPERVQLAVAAAQEAEEATHAETDSQ
jgi:hypothetical protein